MSSRYRSLSPAVALIKTSTPLKKAKLVVGKVVGDDSLATRRMLSPLDRDVSASEVDSRTLHVKACGCSNYRLLYLWQGSFSQRVHLVSKTGASFLAV